jgi:hypothetical protein
MTLGRSCEDTVIIRILLIVSNGDLWQSGIAGQGMAAMRALCKKVLAGGIRGQKWPSLGKKRARLSATEI